MNTFLFGIDGCLAAKLHGDAVDLSTVLGVSKFPGASEPTCTISSSVPLKSALCLIQILTADLKITQSIHDEHTMQ